MPPERKVLAVSENERISTGDSEKSKRPVSPDTEDRFNVGRSAELLVAARLVELGFNIFIPYSDRSPVDLVSLWVGQLYRIQVKARWLPREWPGQDVTVAGVDALNADALIIYIHKPTSFYVIPTEELGGESTLIFYPSGRSMKPPKRYWDEWRDRWDILKKAPTRT